MFAILFQLYYAERGKAKNFSFVRLGRNNRMDFSKFIVGRRGGLSDRFGEQGPDSSASQPDLPLKPKQLFIADNGGVYKRKPDGTNKEVMLPGHLPASKPEHSADDRAKRQTLMRLKLLIQMRDLTRSIIETYRAEKTGVATAYSVRGQQAWLPLQAELLRAYKTFVWDFGAIHKFEIKEKGDMDFDGLRQTKVVRPNLKKFKKDPDAGLLGLVEVYDDVSCQASLGPIFSADLSWILKPGQEPGADAAETLTSAVQGPERLLS